MMRWLPSIRWGGAAQSDRDGDWEGCFLRFAWGRLSAELTLTRLDRDFRHG